MTINVVVRTNKLTDNSETYDVLLSDGTFCIEIDPENYKIAIDLQSNIIEALIKAGINCTTHSHT